MSLVQIAQKVFKRNLIQLKILKNLNVNAHHQHISRMYALNAPNRAFYVIANNA